MIMDEEMLRLEDELRHLLGISPEECSIFNEEANEEEWEEEEAPDFWAELKRAAWSITREHPGIEREDWIERLISEYPSEVVDALGTNPFDVYPQLTDMWDCNDYEDPESGECLSFRDWSEHFANQPEVLREKLEEAYDRINELEDEINRLKNFDAK